MIRASPFCEDPFSVVSIYDIFHIYVISEVCFLCHFLTEKIYSFCSLLINDNDYLFLFENLFMFPPACFSSYM